MRGLDPWCVIHSFICLTSSAPMYASTMLRRVDLRLNASGDWSLLSRLALMLILVSMLLACPKSEGSGWKWRGPKRGLNRIGRRPGQSEEQMKLKLLVDLCRGETRIKEMDFIPQHLICGV